MHRVSPQQCPDSRVRGIIWARGRQSLAIFQAAIRYGADRCARTIILEGAGNLVPPLNRGHTKHEGNYGDEVSFARFWHRARPLGVAPLGLSGSTARP